MDLKALCLRLSLVLLLKTMGVLSEEKCATLQQDGETYKLCDTGPTLKQRLGLSEDEDIETAMEKLANVRGRALAAKDRALGGEHGVDTAGSDNGTCIANDDGVIRFESGMSNSAILPFEYGVSNSQVGPAAPVANPSSATGPKSVVAVTNFEIEARTKQGDVVFGRTSFVDVLNVALPQNPKVIFDTHEGRFVVIVHEFGAFAPTSTRIAVSKTDNPTSFSTYDWFFYKLETDQTDPDNGLTLFPEISQLAVDSEALYIASGMFNTFSSGQQASYLFILDKKTYYNGYPTSSFAALKLNGFETCTNSPAMVRDPDGVGFDGIGTFLVCYNGIFAIETGEEFLQIQYIRTPLTNPTLSRIAFYSLGNIEEDTLLPLNPAPQKGSSKRLNVGDRSAYDAIWFGGKLGVVSTLQELQFPFSLRTNVFGVILDPRDPLSAEVRIVDGDAIAPGTYTYYPSLDVGPSGDAMVGFSASGDDLFPGAYATLVDPDGNAGSIQTVKAGTAPYEPEIFFTGDISYGGYSSVALDPEFSNCFWAFNQFAQPNTACGTGDPFAGCWGTEWARFCASRVQCDGDGSCGGSCGDCSIAEYGRKGCSCDSCECQVCARNSWCCRIGWDGYCAELAEVYCECGEPTPSPTTLSPTGSAEPSISAAPSVSQAPSVSAQPSVSQVPSISAAPSVSQAPSASAQPSVSQAPSASANPSVSAAPSTSQAPSPSPATKLPTSISSVIPSGRPSLRPTLAPMTPAPVTETPSTSPSVMPSSSPTTPFTLVSPQNGDDVTNPEVTFEWTLVWNPADINRVVYHIEYKDETTRVWTRLYRGDLPVQDDGVYEDTQNLVDLGGPSAFAEYKWRILVDAKPRTGFPSIKTDWVLFDLVN